MTYWYFLFYSITHTIELNKVGIDTKFLKQEIDFLPIHQTSPTQREYAHGGVFQYVCTSIVNGP